MRIKSVLMVMVGVLALFGGLGQSAYARGKHASKAPRVHTRGKTNQYGGKYLKSKKQNSPGHYHRTL